LQPLQAFNKKATRIDTGINNTNGTSDKFNADVVDPSGKLQPV